MFRALLYEIQRLLCAKPTFHRRHTEQSSLSRGLFAWRFPVIHLSSKPASRLFPFTLMSFSPSKKLSFLKNFFFRDESKELFSITISTLRVTTLNSPMPRGMSLTNCGREMIRRQPVTVTGAPVVALAGGFGTRLRDHFGRFLGRLFPPVQALCGLSNRLLFSSQPFFL